MSKFAYKTIGNVSPQGKPHVYFACHPDDLHAFLEEYALKICHIQDCAIWYETEYEADYDREELEAQLAEMQLIVMPVTTKLLTAPNRAMDVEFEIAQTRHIPVLPVMLESGLDDVYEKRFGSLQYIDPNDQDPTRRSFDEVLETYIKKVLVDDELYEETGTIESRRDLAISYNRLGDIAREQRKYEEALEYDENGLEIKLALTEETGTFESRRYLFVSYVRLGDIASEQRKYEEAREYYEKGLEFSLALVEETGTIESRRDLSVSYNRLGNIASEQRKLEEAREYYEKGLEISLALTEETGTIDSRRDLSVSYNNLGDIAIAQGKLEKAREYYEKGLELRLALAEETGTIESRRDLSVSYNNLGDIAMAQRKYEEALEYYEKCLKISLALVEETGTIKSRRYLSLSYNRLGDIASAQRKYDEAREYYEKVLEIRLALTEETERISDIIELQDGYFKLGKLYYKQIRDRKKADEMFRAALDLGEKSDDTELSNQTKRILKEYKEVYYPVEIPQAYRSKEAYAGIKEILIDAAKRNPYAKKVYCAPDIPEKRAQKAAYSYAMQLNWRDIIVLEEYPMFLNKNKTIIYTDKILDSDWLDNRASIEHNLILKVVKIGKTELKLYLEPAGDITLDFGNARDSVYFMIAEMLKAVRGVIPEDQRDPQNDGY